MEQKLIKPSTTQPRGKTGNLPKKINLSLSEDLRIREIDEANSIYGGVAISVKTLPQEDGQDSNRISAPKPQTPNPTPITKPHNWSTSLQTVLDQPPSTLPQRLMFGGLAFCIAFGAWANWGQIDEIGHAQGKLIPKGDVYKIHATESGKIAKIQVKEGEGVKRGEAVIELDTELAAAEVERLQQAILADQTQLNQTQVLIERTKLEGQSQTAITNADIQSQEKAIAQSRAKITMLTKQLNELEKGKTDQQVRLERLKPLQDSVQLLIAQRQADLKAAQERIERLTPLLKEGAVPKERIYDAQQRVRDSESAIIQSQLQEMTNAKEQIFQAEEGIRDCDRTITQTQGEIQQTLAEVERLQAGLAQKTAEGQKTQLQSQQQLQKLEVEIGQLKAKIAENQNLLNSAKTKLKQRFLTAPVDGVISSLNIPNIGEVIQPGQTIAEIAPQNAPLVLSASLPDREAGFIKSGMPVQIKLAAYPYQEYGIVAGKVSSISPDSKPNEQVGAVYRVEVTLERNYVSAHHQTFPFKAGETATAEIIIRRRRVIDILLDPIKQLQKSGIDL
ncbi:MAG TPA: secretion protein HlyD [Cyanobacteria bacterium UBA11149]|nr:secretion protein HlyD [Cyanobacteria bacterium UBA11366]HBR76565.1 secretion protein HlyD [Cyanobacteria bacterium UBA11159]HBS72010.1 secretion protein HlyD [Cyanobacteria bacterium UBA11153]HBW92192.1 secretion protein HlyD [Cyanobacteria bacterium UBA11149]